MSGGGGGSKPAGADSDRWLDRDGVAVRHACEAPPGNTWRVAAASCAVGFPLLAWKAWSSSRRERNGARVHALKAAAELRRRSNWLWEPPGCATPREYPKGFPREAAWTVVTPRSLCQISALFSLNHWGSIQALSTCRADAQQRSEPPPFLAGQSVVSQTLWREWEELRFPRCLSCIVNGASALEGGRRRFCPPARFPGIASAAACSPPASRPTTATTTDERRGLARHTWCAFSFVRAPGRRTKPSVRSRWDRPFWNGGAATTLWRFPRPFYRRRRRNEAEALHILTHGGLTGTRKKGPEIQTIRHCLAFELYLSSSLFLHLSAFSFRISARASRISSRCVWQL